MANSLQTIMRMSAVIYSEQQQSTRSAKTVERVFIEAVLVKAQNTPLTIEQIITALQDDFTLTYQEPEIRPIVNDDKYFTCVLAAKEENNTYYLPHNRYERLSQKEEKGIEQIVNAYVAQQQADIDSNVLKELLYKYLYSLLNTNINAFRQLLEKKAKNVSSVIDTDAFDAIEIDNINAFLNWDNDAKDEALFALVSCCVDYASAINKVDQNDVVKALRNKCIYLDNSLLYRALGINGTFRKSRVYNLFQRCIQSGQKLYVSSTTRKEFFETIAYHINELNQSTPYGHINPQLFYKYTCGHSFYQYYHEWRKERDTYGLKSLELHIHTEYNNLLQRFGIQEDFKQPFNEEGEAQTIDKYSEEIQQYKVKKHQHLNENDAYNMLWIEKHRGGNDHNIRDTKYYFLTSDKKLQEWDLSHSQNQPITMLPSQWLALLLKFYSRSLDDYKCFVSFLTISKDKAEISAEELQQTLAGISEITEDFQKQDDIVSALLELEDTNQYRTREAAKKFAKEKLEEKYLEQLKAKDDAHNKEIANIQNANKEQIAQVKNESEMMLKAIKDEFSKRDKDNRIEKLNDRIIAMKRTIKDLEDKNALINNIANEKENMLKRGCGIALTIIFIAWIYLIIHFGWDCMEMYTYFVGALIFVIPIIVSFISDKTINPNVLFKRYRNYVFNKICREYDYNEATIEDSKLTLQSLQDQLTEEMEQ